MSDSYTSCPVCEARVDLQKDTEVSEIVTCNECQSNLVVSKMGSSPLLEEAPEVDEDWGE